MLSSRARQLIGPLFPIANQVRLAWLRIKYKGDKVYCPCCGSRFHEFAPFSVWKRKNSWCPKCQSLERDRLLWMYLENKTNIYRQPVRFLHIAPERVFFNHFKKQSNINYFPADKFPNAYPPGTRYIDVLNIEMPDNIFDVVICNHVFQYIQDDKKAMKELFRVLKPGGWAILQVPINRKLSTTYEDFGITDPKEREKAFGLAEHVRFYGLDYADRLRETGFQVIVDNYTDSFSEDEIFRYGFWAGDSIYFCRKYPIVNSL